MNNLLKYTVALLVILVAACSTTNKGEVILGVKDIYTLTPTEQEAPFKNDKQAGLYGRLFNHYEKAQIPLHKYVAGDGYDMYFGIPIGYNRAGFYYTMMKDSAFTVLNNNADEKKYYNKILRKTDSLYVSTSVIENIFNASYYIVHITGKDSSQISNMYEQDYAFKKLTFK
ncbi:MAG: hypothetical protein HKO56_07355 [Bacteroidia bacterium]|nr:hypothetical protein [Bacteroidia bacterium]NNC86819.1 hypothetical protein [Bacteroidia bacterium]NNM16457.1 hypothetical protein [Bacteroidia bacterium]